tara:strand:- start:171 stop:434 length:264 start_codon:yes stop_codon:yes gene_type:complete
MKTKIHINQHIIRSNTKYGKKDPVITCKNYKENNYGHSVIIKDRFGDEVARVVYSPDKPMSCGAKVWIETENEIVVINDNEKIRNEY